MIVNVTGLGYVYVVESAEEMVVQGKVLQTTGKLDVDVWLKMIFLNI